MLECFDEENKEMAEVRALKQEGAIRRGGKRRTGWMALLLGAPLERK